MQSEAQYREAKRKVKFLIEWGWFIPFLISIFFIPLVFFDFSFSNYYRLLILMQFGFLGYYFITFKEIATPLIGTTWEKIQTVIYRVFLIVWLDFSMILSFWGLLLLIQQAVELTLLYISFLIFNNFILFGIGMILFLIPNVYPPKMAKKYRLVYLKRTPD